MKEPSEMSKGLLSADKVAAIDAGLQAIHDMLPVLDDATECGIDCQHFRSQAAELQKYLTEMKRRFG